MGLLGQTYASPQFMLDWAVESGLFVEFIVKVFDDYNDKRLWDVFLHSETEQTFDEFKQALKDKRDSQTATPEQIGGIINASRRILARFNPKEGEPDA